MGKHSGIIVAVILLTFVIPFVRGQVDVIRSPVSGQFYPGDVVDFDLNVYINENQEGVIITELIPDGWLFIESDPDIDKSDNNQIKWMFTGKGNIGNKTITYSLKLSEETGDYDLMGYWKSIDNDGKKNTDVIKKSDIEIVPENGGSSGSSQGSGSKTSKTSKQSSDGDFCSPFSTKCDGSLLLTCSEDGKSWVIDETCFECLDGECIEYLIKITEPENEVTNFEIVKDDGVDLTGRFLERELPLIGGLLVIVVIIGFIVFKNRSKITKVTKKDRFRYEYKPRF